MSTVTLLALASGCRGLWLDCRTVVDKAIDHYAAVLCSVLVVATLQSRRATDSQHFTISFTPIMSSLDEAPCKQGSK